MHLKTKWYSFVGSAMPRQVFEWCISPAASEGERSIEMTRQLSQKETNTASLVQSQSHHMDL